jgi:hypothetical protein
VTKLDYYERHLLALALEAALERGTGLRADFDHGRWWAEAPSVLRVPCSGPTLADALTALLTDLGIEPPSRPSEEAIEAAREDIFDWDDRKETIARRDPLLAAAVLEAGS